MAKQKHEKWCISYNDPQSGHTGECSTVIQNGATPASLPFSEVGFIREQFRKLFAQSANLIEAVMGAHDDRTEKVKDLLGGFQNQTEHDILITVQDKLS